MTSSLMGRVFRGLFALSFVVVGCGGNDSGGATNKDQFIAKLCAEFSTCCAAAGRPSDGAQCRAFYGAFTPATGFDATAGNACLSEVRALSNKCDNRSTDTPSCRLVFADGEGGRKQPGETCEEDHDCAAASEGDVECVSRFVNSANVQQCQVRLPGKVGSTPCVGTVDGNLTFYSGSDDSFPPQGYLCDKADGLTCDGQSGACVALTTVGESCVGSFSGCVPDAYCGMDGKCTARAQAGSPCTNDSGCVEEARCETGTKLCVARLAEGATCTASSECASSDCTNGKCAPETDLTLSFLCGTN